MRGSIVALALGVVACGPKVPTQTEARAAFDARRDRIQTFEDSIFKMMGISPGEASPGQIEGLVVAVDALGLDGGKLLPSVPPCIGGTGPGEVKPEQGLTVDHFSIGYGLYQTAWDDGTKHGDGDMHPGITVRWRLGGEESMLEDPVTLCFLIDGTPRPK
jgi:hypothetical protein